MTIVTPERPKVHAPRTPRPPQAPVPTRSRRHWLWLAAGAAFAFAVPFLLADTLELGRDVYYGLYALGVAAFTAAWACSTGLGRADLTRNRRWGLVLGAAGAALLAVTVLRTEHATDRSGGLGGGPAPSSRVVAARPGEHEDEQQGDRDLRPSHRPILAS